MESNVNTFLALLVIVSLVRRGSTMEDTLSCFLRAKSHYVLGDPDKGKYYAFTFQPPSSMDRDILDPCFFSCIMSSRCSAILFYKPSTKSVDDDGDVGRPGSCKMVLTDEAMRFEVMYGDVADLYIKRSDKNCDRDGAEAPRSSSSKMTPMIIAGDPRLYSNPMIRHLLGSSNVASKTNGRYDKPRLQLNALNFLWGHQVFANIYHNGNTRHGKYTDRQGWDNHEQDKERSGNLGMVSTTLPSPTTRRPLTRAVVKAGHVTNGQGDVSNRNINSNRIHNMYNDNEEYMAYEPKNNAIEEPVGGEMFGTEEQAIETETNRGIGNIELPKDDVSEMIKGDRGVLGGGAGVSSSDGMPARMDVGVSNTTPAVPTATGADFDQTGDENSRRPRTFFKEDVLRLIFGDLRRGGFVTGLSSDLTSTDASTATTTAATSSISSSEITTTSTATSPSAVAVDAAVAANKLDTIDEENAAISSRTSSSTTGSTTSVTLDVASLPATESTMAVTESSTMVETTDSPTTTITSTSTSSTVSSTSTGDSDSTASVDRIMASQMRPDMKGDDARRSPPLSIVLSGSILRRPDPEGVLSRNLAVPPESSGSKNDSQPTPKTIAFSATLGSTLSVGLSENSRIIVFDDVLLNKGSAYNASSGVFTAPVDGVYVFIVDIQSMRGTLASVKVMRNDDVIHSIRANGRNTGDRGTGSGTISIFLSRGDDVYAKLFYDTGYTYVRKAGSRFTGFKLP